ncbi:MAG: hypothetical protein K0Q49_2342, partial [Haloplasmataceae bacterium]|nr:hypothetical protein [Haloplasmataceae bacterium]
EDMSSGTNRSNVLKALKKAGFKNGGIATDGSGYLSDLIKQTGEHKIALVRNGEGFVSPEDVPVIKDLLKNLQPLNNLVKLTTPNLSNVITNNSSPIFNFEKMIDFSGATITGDGASSKIESASNNLINQIMNRVRSL